MANLLDKMPKEKAELHLKRYEQRRKAKEAQEHEVPYSWFVTAQLGYYLGWEAVMAIRNGYTITKDVDRAGKVIHVKNVFTLEEAMMLIDACRKVWSSQVVDNAYSTLAGSGSKYSDNPGEALMKAMDSYIKNAEVK